MLKKFQRTKNLFLNFFGNWIKTTQDYLNFLFFRAFNLPKSDSKVGQLRLKRVFREQLFMLKIKSQFETTIKPQL